MKFKNVVRMFIFLRMLGHHLQQNRRIEWALSNAGNGMLSNDDLDFILESYDQKNEKDEDKSTYFSVQIEN